MIMHVFHIPFAEADYTYNYILLFLNMLISNELNPCQIGSIIRWLYYLGIHYSVILYIFNKANLSLRCIIPWSSLIDIST